jgi:outer membrane protein assembly factor BamE (lipoprotein component of BamABCDE complex)
MKHTLTLMSVVLLLAGCDTPGHIGEGDPTKLSVGMTKEEVFKKIGKPEAVTTDGNAEILGYTRERPWWQTSRFRVRTDSG